MAAKSSGPRRWVYRVILAAVAVIGSWAAYRMTSTPRPPTIDEYIASVGLGATKAEPGFQLAGVTPDCHGLPIVLDPTLDDVAAAHAGFIILNRDRMAKLPKVVQLYAFGHECGHQVHGLSEEKADCQAITDGKRDGWLDAAGVGAICDFWKPYQGDSAHLPGPDRCQLMQRCFAEGMQAAGR
ncbi:MAG: hypothetical protein R3D57_01170 [Hyphomicrobiaceae bacterium]